MYTRLHPVLAVKRTLFTHLPNTEVLLVQPLTVHYYVRCEHMAKAILGMNGVLTFLKNPNYNSSQNPPLHLHSLAFYALCKAYNCHTLAWHSRDTSIAAHSTLFCEPFAYGQGDFRNRQGSVYSQSTEFQLFPKILLSSCTGLHPMSTVNRTLVTHLRSTQRRLD